MQSIAMFIIPRVTTNGAMRPIVIITPLASPRPIP